MHINASNKAERIDTTNFTEINGSPVPGVKLRRLIGPLSNDISRLLWAHKDRLLASVSVNGILVIWNDLTGNIEQTIELLAPSSGMAWSPDATTIVTDPYAGALQLWDVVTGKIARRIEGTRIHERGVSWSPDGKYIALPSNDGSTKLWDASTSQLNGILPTTSTHLGVNAWSSNGQFLALASFGNQIEIWDIDKNKRQSILVGHRSAVRNIAWSPVDKFIVSTCSDNVIHVWDPMRGTLYHSLEAHTEAVNSVSFSYDGSLLVSKSHDNTVRIWRCDTWETVAILIEPSQEKSEYALAFHPTLPILASFDSTHHIIRIWELDINLLLGKTTAETLIHYTTAKVVLVGDSGVGKTGLGWRLANGEFKEHSSTHGQQFWLVDELNIKRKDGAECEAVLWDLAGQHIYRSVHTIFLNNVDLALLLFDATNRQETLKGVEFWLEQLAQQNRTPPCILIGARSDRGTSVISRQELSLFCQRRGISGGFIHTSAKSGEGLEQLLRLIKEQIAWEDKTTTVTTRIFKQIKDFILELKEDQLHKRILIETDHLREWLGTIGKDWHFDDSELIATVRHLENHGYVAVIRSSSGHEYVLLKPEILVELASSMVLQADKHPRELGCLNETALMNGGYSFPELQALAIDEQQVLLDAAIVRFLSHNVCFREILGAETLLIFPGLIKQKRPLFEHFETEEDTSYILRGRVENVYSALVALLGYTHNFTRVNQWHGQAQYELGPNGICGFRLIEEREGEIELVIYYSISMPAYGRKLFQGLFEQFLYQRDVSVVSFPLIRCSCGHRQERATVIKRIREGKSFLFCEECGKQIALPKDESVLTLDEDDSNWIRREEALARLRTLYETQLVRVKGFRRDRESPRCYISHLPEQSMWAAKLSQDLRAAGVYIVSVPSQIKSGDKIVVVSTPAYYRSYKLQSDVIGADVSIIKKYIEQGGRQASNLIAILLESETVLVEHYQPRDFRQETRYVIGLFDLVLALYGIPLNHPAFEPLRRSLQDQWERNQAIYIEHDSHRASTSSISDSAETHFPAAEIVEQIKRILSVDLRDKATDVAALLSELATNAAIERAPVNEGIVRVLEALSGSHIPTSNGFITFKENSQFGDVSFGDIAGGSIIKVTLNLLSPEQLSVKRINI